MKTAFSWSGAFHIPLLIAVIATSCSSSRNSTASGASNSSGAQWQATPLIIDGSDKDWPRPLPWFNQSESVAYDITNDGQKLYILLSTKNPQEQQKIIRGGMTVWVNTKGDKSNGDAVGIGYPLDEHSDPDRNLMEQAQPQRYDHNKPVTLQDKKEYALYGFNKDSAIQNYAYMEANPQGIEVRMEYNDAGDLIYEAAIPLTTLYPKHNPSSSWAAESPAVGIFIEGLPPDVRMPRQGGGIGGSGVGVGVGGGVGTFGSGMGVGLSFGGGGGGMGGGRSNKQLYQETQIWKEAQLASH
jgi:Tfp pilus assembly protein PilZ